MPACDQMMKDNKPANKKKQKEEETVQLPEEKRRVETKLQ